MYNVVKPKFKCEVSKDVESKLALSLKETENMTFRTIYCPNCGTRVVDVFEDIVGHFAAKCSKCKGTVLVNSAYFHSSSYRMGKKKYHWQKRHGIR